MASIQDVARLAQVGVGTVSRVINNNGYVAPQTRQKVETAIAQLHYTPNELARNLLHKRTSTIAVITPNLALPYYAELTNETEMELRKRGYRTLVCNTVGQSTNEQKFLDMLESNMVDGVITGTHTLDTNRYQHQVYPIVGFDTPMFSKNMSVISADHEAGGLMAAEALINSGCREVLQFTDVNLRQYPYMKRHSIFRRRMKEAGIPCHDCRVQWNMFDSGYAEWVTEEMLKLYPDVDGVFGTDSYAVYYMRHALECGKRIPENLRIVAYDGTDITRMAYPVLSTVVQPIRDLALAGVEQLMHSIEKGCPEKKRVTLPVTFRKGMTTL